MLTLIDKEGNEFISAGYVQGMWKKPSLFIHKSQNEIHKVATFTNEQEAVLFMQFLGKCIGASWEERRQRNDGHKGNRKSHRCSSWRMR